MTLRARIYVLVALAVAPAFALLIHDHYRSLQQREADAQQQALRSTWLVSAELDQVFKGIESLLRAAAQTAMVNEFKNPECTDFLRRLGGINPNAGRIVAADRSGLIRCGAGAGIVRMSDRDYFTSALKSDELAVGTYTIGRGSGAPILPLAIQFSSAEGPAVLVAGVRLDWLRKHFSGLFAGLPPHSSLTIVDRNGIMLVRLPNSDREGKQLQTYDYVVNAPKPGVFRSTAEKNADGIARFLGFTPLDSRPRGVAIAVGFPQETVLAAAHATTLRNATLLGLAAILALMAAVFAGRAFIHRPMVELLATIERWHRGDLSARAPHASDRSEFDQVGKAFNSLAAELESALKYKDVLLRELSHRVMNSLQTVTALFRLQSKSIKEPSDAAQFDDAIRRIDAIALVYQRMQAIHGVESMEFSSFLEELCNGLRKSVLERPCIVKADRLIVSPKQAIPLSLIANELLANAIKHGSKGRNPIVVELTNSPEQCRLSVRNDGSLPEGSMPESTRFGMKMISSMVSQLDGTLEVSSSDGKTDVIVCFQPRVPQPSISRSAASEVAMRTHENLVRVVTR